MYSSIDQDQHLATEEICETSQHTQL